MDTQVKLIPTKPATDEAIDRLVEVSNRRVIDLDKSFAWKDGVDKTRRPKAEENAWLFGTRFWDMLTDEQKHEMLWAEIARDISMFIWLEQRLPPLYVGYINKYREDIPSPVYDYLMVFSREEIVHTLAFRRYVKAANISLFAPPVGYATLFDTLPAMHPVVGILYTLIIEWVAELGAMHIAKDKSIDPLTRQLFVVHHFDEARHIAFGKQIVQDFFDSVPAQELDVIRGRVASHLPNLFSQYTYNDEIRTHLSFDFPVPLLTPDIESEIRLSPNNRRLNEVRFREIFDWLDGLGIKSHRA